jgi:hypothetical protein
MSLRSKTSLVPLFIAVLTLLFGLLTLPGLANEPSAPLLRNHYVPLSETSLRAPLQITFTPVATLFLPIIQKPPAVPNNLEITKLVFSGTDEYVEVRNNSPGSQSFDGWQIVSVVGSQTYNFPNGVVLEVGQMLRVHSGPDAFNSPPSNLFWTTAYIWNNDGDKAELRDHLGALRDSFCYIGGCPQ